MTINTSLRIASVPASNRVNFLRINAKRINRLGPDAKADAKKRIEEKKAETSSKIDEWKANRDQRKLEKRADRSEDYAAVCIVIAANSVAEAELATLEAIEARLLAEEFAANR